MLADDIMENDCVVQPDGDNAVSVVDATIFHLNLLDILWDVLSSCLVLMYSFVFLTPRLLLVASPSLPGSSQCLATQCSSWHTRALPSTSGLQDLDKAAHTRALHLRVFL